MNIHDPKYPKTALCDPKLFHLHYRVSRSDQKGGRADYCVTRNGLKIEMTQKDLKWTKMTWNEHNDPKYPKMTLCDPKLFHLHYRVSISDPKVGRAHYRVTQDGLKMTPNDLKNLKWPEMTLNEHKWP